MHHLQKDQPVHQTYYVPPLLGRGIKQWCCLTSVCLSDVSLSVAYIGPSKTKIGTVEAYVIRHTWLGHHFQGQGHQAALLTAMLAYQVAEAVGVGKCWPWETAAMLPSARRCETLRCPRGRGEGCGISWRPPAYSLFCSAMLNLVAASLSLQIRWTWNREPGCAFLRWQWGCTAMEAATMWWSICTVWFDTFDMSGNNVVNLFFLLSRRSRSRCTTPTGMDHSSRPGPELTTLEAVGNQWRYALIVVQAREEEEGGEALTRLSPSPPASLAPITSTVQKFCIQGTHQTTFLWLYWIRLILVNGFHYLVISLSVCFGSCGRLSWLFR